MALLGLLAACAPEPVPVTIVAPPESLPAGVELVDLEVTLWPVDVQALIDSLEAASAQPKPTFPELEAELRGFVPPGPVELGRVDVTWRATRDSTRRLADSLRRVDRASDGYAAAYGRFRALYRRLASRAATRERAFRERTGDVQDLATRAGDAADSLRVWEEQALAPLDSLLRHAVNASGRELIRVTLGPDGAAEVILAPGPWWVAVTAAHSVNPFLDHRWDVLVRVRGFLPLRVGVFPVQHRPIWRH